MQDRIDELMAQVEREYQMGGLSDGIYGDFARDVAQLVAKDCAMIAEGVGDGAVGSNDGGERAASTIRTRYSLDQ